MKERKGTKILILYAEVMEYLLAGIKTYIRDYEFVEIMLFELDKKKLTNFKFNDPSFLYKRKSEFTDYLKFEEVCINFSPNLILVSGRMDKHYLKICKYFKRKGVYTVTMQDTQYRNSLRQNLIRLAKEFLYKPYFSGFWGAGSLQTAFALSLGFSHANVFEGVYTANTAVYNGENVSSSSNGSGKTLLYVGRLVEEKNILNLVSIFKIANRSRNNEHRLILIGSGSLSPIISSDSEIKVLPFMASEKIRDIAKNVDIFCLPSSYEPWGVVIHEFVSLGLPLLVSSECGAAKNFLINGFNGLEFDVNDNKSLLLKLNDMLDMTSSQLRVMGSRSRLLSKRNSPDIWAATLNSIVLKATTT